jgi:hypothetical protein
MKVPFPPESASIRPLNPPRRSFLLRLDVLRLCCRAPAFHGLPVAVDEGDEVRLPALAGLVGSPPAWARPVGVPAAWAWPIEASPACFPLPPALLWVRSAWVPPASVPRPVHLLVATMIRMSPGVLAMLVSFLSSSRAVTMASGVRGLSV